MNQRTSDLAGDRLLLMQTFVRIVEAGSLSAAASQLGAAQPTISRRLQALEKMFGVRLVHRSTHAMTLTEDGRRCFERSRELLAAWESFEAGMRMAATEPEGLLRVVVPHAFGQQQLVEPLVRYLKRYPAVQVEWLLRDETQSMVSEGIDCAIQVGEVTDPLVVVSKLSEVRRIMVAAPQLLKGRKIPVDPADAATLPWLALKTYYRNEVSLQHLTSEQTRQLSIRPRMSTDSLYALRCAAVDGLGVAIVSAWLVADDIEQGRLLHLAPQWQATPLPIYLAYRHASFYPAKLKKFIEAMKTAMPKVVHGLASRGEGGVGG